MPKHRVGGKLGIEGGDEQVGLRHGGEAASGAGGGRRPCNRLF